MLCILQITQTYEGVTRLDSMENTKERTASQEATDNKETGRIEAFSDGVFAVAITLLVLDIHPPPGFPEDAKLIPQLLDQWPIYAAFITSFFTIGVMWVNHHRLFTHIKRTDNTLLLLNLLLLLVIVFIPFPTALVAQYFKLPDDHAAAEIYSGTCIVLAICYNLLWRYASHERRLLDSRSDPEEVEAITRQYRYGPLFYVVTFAVAFISAPASMILNMLLALFFALPGRKKTR